MGYTLGMPSMKLNNVQGKGGRHTGNFRSVAEEALAERLGKDLDINHELTKENEYLTGIQSAKELIEYTESFVSLYNAEIDKHNAEIENAVAEYNSGRDKPLSKTKALKEINAEREAAGKPPLKSGKHLREDAVLMCATIIKPPLDYMIQLSKEKQRKLLIDSYDKLGELVGRDNIKAAVIHWDEGNPHLHVFWQPVTADGRLCAKEMHDIKFFGKLNREMPAYMREQGWNIDDCNMYDSEEEQKLRESMSKSEYREHLKEKREKNGRSSQKYKHAVREEIAKAEEKLQGLQERITSLEYIPKPPQAPEKPKAPNHIRIECSRKEYIKQHTDSKLSFRERRERERKLGETYDNWTADYEAYDKEMAQYSDKLSVYRKQVDEWNEKYNVANTYRQIVSEINHAKAEIEREKAIIEQERAAIRQKETLVQRTLNEAAKLKAEAQLTISRGIQAGLRKVKKLIKKPDDERYISAAFMQQMQIERELLISATKEKEYEQDCR